MGKYVEIFKWYFRDPKEVRIKACQKTVDDYKAGKIGNDIYTQIHSKVLPLLINQRDTIKEALTYFTPEEQAIITESYAPTDTSMTVGTRFNMQEQQVKNTLSRFTSRYKKLGGNDTPDSVSMKPILDYHKAEKKHERSSN